MGRVVPQDFWQQMLWNPKQVPVIAYVVTAYSLLHWNVITLLLTVTVMTLETPFKNAKSTSNRKLLGRVDSSFWHVDRCWSGRGLWFPSLNTVRAMSTSGGPTPPFTTLAVTHPANHITHVELHRPEKRNAMNKAYWRYVFPSPCLKKKKGHRCNCGCKV